jgi:hypothetical protein
MALTNYSGDEHPEATVEASKFLFSIILTRSGPRNRSQPHPTQLVSTLPHESPPPNTHSLPPNVTFEIDDAEETWTYSQKFDFVHARMMTGSFANVPKFFDQVYEYPSLPAIPHP